MLVSSYILTCSHRMKQIYQLNIINLNLLNNYILNIFLKKENIKAQEKMIYLFHYVLKK
jgi:hypothetical protein